MEVLTITITQMFKRFILFIVALILSLGVDAKMYGLFYGIDGDLGCPENDVTDLAELYRKNDGQVILVIGDGVTRSNVLDGLKKQANACTPNDIIMFVYSGHGNDGYIQCGSQFVKFSEIKHILSDCKARRKVVIIDACFSGSFTSQKYGKLTGENVIVITASRRNEESGEVRGSRNSLFFESLLNALNGKADKNRDGIVTAKEAYDYMSPIFKGSIFMSQHPTMKGRFNENTILYTYKRGGGATPDKPSVKPEIKPSTPLPGVAPVTTQVETNEASTDNIFMKYAKAVYHWLSWWKVIGFIAGVAVLVYIFKYFIAYKLLMKYL